MHEPIGEVRAMDEVYPTLEEHVFPDPPYGADIIWGDRYVEEMESLGLAFMAFFLGLGIGALPAMIGFLWASLGSPATTTISRFAVERFYAELYHSMQQSARQFNDYGWG